MMEVKNIVNKDETTASILKTNNKFDEVKYFSKKVFIHLPIKNNIRAMN